MILDVGCGHLRDHKRREGIGIDLHRGTCDIVADAHYLPFRPSTFKKIYARNILEHMNNPMAALEELKRVLMVNGEMSITLPIYHNLCTDELIRFLAEFPFRIPITLKRLWRWRKHRYELGFSHKNRIGPRHVARFFTVLRCFPLHQRHSLLRIRKGKLLRPFGVQWLPTLPDIQYIYVCKASRETTRLVP